jgi:Ni/Co efflux regulator RcnB
MKTLISATLAALLLGVSAAGAAPFYGPHHGPSFHREMARYAPRHHVWVRGERFMPAYGRAIFVEDWRGLRLPAPRFGAHWVRVGGDVLLVENRNGVILDVIFNRF